MRVDEDLRKRLALTGNEPPGDLVGVPEVIDRDIDHERREVPAMIDETPPAVTAFEPALQRVGEEQLAHGFGRTRRDAEVGPRRTAGGTPAQRERDERDEREGDTVTTRGCRDAPPAQSGSTVRA